MKTFLAVILLSACAAYVFAEDLAFHKSVFQFLDERHDENMAQVVRDHGLSDDALVASDHPKPPEFLVSKDSFYFQYKLEKWLNYRVGTTVLQRYHWSLYVTTTSF